MKTRIKLLCMALMLIIISTTANARVVAIGEILRNPTLYEDEDITVSGLVANYIAATSTSTAYYLLKSDFGDMIRVNTAEAAPTTNQKYCITGIVYVNRNDKGIPVKLYISEKSRSEGACIGPILSVQKELVFEKGKKNIGLSKEIVIANSGNEDLRITNITITNKEAFELVMPEVLTIKPGKSINLGVVFTPKKYGNYSATLSIFSNAENGQETVLVSGKTFFINPAVLILICALALLLAIGAILLFNRKRNNQINILQNTKTQNIQNIHTVSNATDTDFKTIAIPKPSPKTVKWIPGEFEIIAGDDLGKRFKIAGFTNGEGSVVTVGREKILGELANHHIELKEMTVGRKQAEFIYKNKSLYVRNLADTNPTIVDGHELQFNSMVEVKPNSIIQFGEVSMAYRA